MQQIYKNFSDNKIFVEINTLAKRVFINSSQKKSVIFSDAFYRIVI